MVIEHAAMICGVVLSREVVVAAAAGRARQQLFEGLLLTRNRDDEELDRWARHLGLDPSRTHDVLTVTLPEPGRSAGLSSVEAMLIRIAPPAVVIARTDEVVAVVPHGSETEAASVAASVAEQCVVAAEGRRLGPLAVGIGNPAPTTATIARSYAEARLALAASERMGDFGGITTFAELGIQRLFLRVPDLEDLRAFADSVIGKLLDGASTAGQEFLDTLAVYFAESGSLQRAAKRLHVHPNTVTYRIRRVEEITGLALDVHRDRLMAEVAVEIIASMGGRR
jgi:sugar diacid utilization regulator